MTGNDVTRPQVTGNDSEVTLFDRKSSGSGYRRLENLSLWCLSLPKRLPASSLELAVEGRKPAYTLRFIAYKAVACRRRQSRDRK